MDVSFQCDSTEIEKALNQGIISVNEVRRLYGFPENPEVVQKLVARTCPNCGAPVLLDVCEYCGSIFTHPTKVAERAPESVAVIRAKLDADLNHLRCEELYDTVIQAMCRRF